MQKDEEAQQGGEEKRGTVLLLDDDKFLLDMYAMKFHASGFEVQSCFSTDEALKILRDGVTPDVILFDITMPGRDGFSFLQSLQEEKLAKKSIKIALTNQSSDEEKKKAEEMGTDHYIVKASMIPSEVVNTVVDALDKRSAHS